MKRLVSGRQRPIDRSTRDAKTFANLSGRQSALGSQRLYPCLEFFFAISLPSAVRVRIRRRSNAAVAARIASNSSP